MTSPRHTAAPPPPADNSAPPRGKLARSALLGVVFLAGFGAGALATGNPDGSARPVVAGLSDGPATASAGDPVAQMAAASAITRDGDRQRGNEARALAEAQTPPDPIPESGGAPLATAGERTTASVSTLAQRLASVSQELNRLRGRVAMLEQQTLAGDDGADAGGGEETAPVMPVRTSQERWDALVSSGVPEGQADDILDRQASLELARLELRDRAAREGWSDSERFRQQSGDLARDVVDLRDEVGEAAYDRYLFNTGARNRVEVESVMQGSAGEASGLLPGDVIEAYAEERIFDARALRDATTRGRRGEQVLLQLRRGDVVVETWVPRGPIGVRLGSVRLEPLP